MTSPTMTVKQLREILTQLPDDLEVWAVDLWEKEGAKPVSECNIGRPGNVDNPDAEADVFCLGYL